MKTESSLVFFGNTKLKLVLFFLILIAGLGYLILKQLPDNNLRLVFCDVGQGDAVLVIHGSRQILIDGGPDESVLYCLSDNMPFWDRKIDLVILTHPEIDHFGGLLSVLPRYEVGKILINKYLSQGEKIEELIDLINDKKIYTLNPQETGQIRIGLLSFDIVRLKKNLFITSDKIDDFGCLENRDCYFQKVLGDWNANEISIVLSLKYNNFRALFTGDSIGESLEDLENQSTLRGHQVIKLAHHGSKHDNPLSFYQKLAPDIVVASVGKNSYGHPDETLLDNLEEMGIRSFRTDRDGEVEIVADGQSYWFEIKKQ